MFCVHCGATVSDTAVVCIKCGSDPFPVAERMRRKGNVGVTENTDTEKQRVMWGWITAVFVPLVGIILGIVNMVKGTLGHGIGQIIASLFFWSFWAGFWAAFFG